MRRDLPCADAIAMTHARTAATPALHGAVDTWAGVDFEPEWRSNPRLHHEGATAACAWGRWSDRRHEQRTLTSPPLDQHYTIEILLSDTLVDCSRSGSIVCTRAGQFGAAQLTAPGERVRCRFERPLESAHLFIPAATLLETLHRCRSSLPAGFALEDPAFRPDPVLGRFVSALSEAGSLHGPSAALFIESACQTVIAYLVRAQLQRAHAEVRPTGLQSWRLHKVMDFIGANATEAISLQAMADQAGLSRMHFAAQFLLATGMTPHTFLTETRLDIAKRLMAEGQLALAAIALQAGFHSQAHFTSVFRKSTGVTPGRWRAQAMAVSIDRGSRALLTLPFASETGR